MYKSPYYPINNMSIPNEINYINISKIKKYKVEVENGINENKSIFLLSK